MQAVRNGNCKWSDPIYESTRLLRDTQSRTYDDKLYKLVIAMGSSCSSILGEGTKNLSNFVDDLKPCAVSLPLQGSGQGTILHANAHLESIFPEFKELPSSGHNALDRVFALEFDLADSLQAKDKDVLFQSNDMMHQRAYLQRGILFRSRRLEVCRLNWMLRLMKLYCSSSRNSGQLPS